MKKRAIAVCLAVLLTFAGCADRRTADEKAKDRTETANLPEPPKPAKLSVEKQSPDELGQLETKHVYSGVLSQMGAALQLPDPATGGYILLESENLSDGSSFMDDNRFAIWDVDDDGREELLVLYTTAPMAGMMEAVYDYDCEKKELSMELMEFPTVTFYENGIAVAQASHNHSYCATFWPCTLYQYQPEKGRYETVAGYAAWSREDYPEVSFRGERIVFPEDLDRDGDGILYGICSGEWDMESYRYDRAEFEAWFDGCMDGAQQIVLLYYPVSYGSYQNFTPAYLEMRYRMQDGVDTGTDIGWMYHNAEWIGDVSQYLEENYNLVMENGDGSSQADVYQDGQLVFRFYLMDGGSMVYYDRKVEDITIFGVYPGMDGQEAKRILSAYGFYDYPCSGYDESEKADGGVSLITGEGFGNIEIYFETDGSGRITCISQRLYSAVTG